MRRLAGVALRLVFAISLVFLVVVASRAGHPPLWTLITYLLVSFFGIGLLFGNLNALAMQPLGRIAGIGAAVVGGSQTLISLACGTVIGQSYDNTVLPLVAGFAVLSGLAMAVIRIAEASGYDKHTSDQTSLGIVAD
jgi:DHA1 family bicyclomycin/chloramphenicol resistance-like MFS transporter